MYSVRRKSVPHDTNTNALLDYLTQYELATSFQGASDLPTVHESTSVYISWLEVYCDDGVHMQH